MERRPSVSVVIPTYQRRDLVMSAIDSVLSQTCPAVEVLVVDDGSTDGTAESLAARQLSGVKVLSQPNRGLSTARNVAIDAARGDVVAFLDSDDRWLPDHLAVLGDLLVRHPRAVLVGTHRDYQFGDETAQDAVARDIAERLILMRTGVGVPSSVAVRRETVLALGGFYEATRYSEDIELFLRLALVGPVALISARTIEIRRSQDSLGGQALAAGTAVDSWVWTADRVLASLEGSDRPDGAALREAALARRSLGFALAAVHRGDAPQRVRDHLEDACTRSPLVEMDPWFLLKSLPTKLPEWDRPERRLGVLVTLAAAWPQPRSPSAVVLRVAAMREAARQGRWRQVLRLSPGLATSGVFGVFGRRRAAVEDRRRNQP